MEVVLAAVLYAQNLVVAAAIAPGERAPGHTTFPDNSRPFLSG